MSKEQELIKEIENYENCIPLSPYVSVKELRAELLGIKEGKREQMEEELEFLEKHFNHLKNIHGTELAYQVIQDRISKLKEMLKECD